MTLITIFIGLIGGTFGFLSWLQGRRRSPSNDVLELAMTASLHKACGEQLWRLDTRHILSHRSRRRGGGLASNTSWRPALVSCPHIPPPSLVEPPALSLRSEIARDSPYVANIEGMRLRLPELQDNDEEAKALRSAGLPEDWEDVEGVLQYRSLPYVPEIIRSEVISRHHDDPLAGHFGIEQIELGENLEATEQDFGLSRRE